MSYEHHDHGTAFGQDSLSDREKLARLLQHWIKHNDDHIKTYREWSDKARAKNLLDVATLREEACEIMASLNTLFKRATEKLN